MSLLDALIGIFTNEDSQQAFQSDPQGFLIQNGFGNVTSQDIDAEMPRVLEAVQGNAGGATQGGAADFSGSGNVVLGPEGAGGGYGGGGYADDGGLSGAVASINHYQSVVNVTEQSFEDNDVTSIDDRDTTVDASVNQNITAFGNVNQDFDNDVVSGDHAAATGDGSQVNTGDGAVQAGGDITDATIGDHNQVIDDSTVGAANFGTGDATDIAGTGGDVTLNSGDGDLTQIQDSTLDHATLDGDIADNDITIDADDGSTVAFGDGADADTDTQDLDIHDTSGTVQVGGDDSTQTQDTDNSINDSFDTTDSYNPDTTLTDNSIDDSFDTTDSYNPDNHLDQTTTTTTEDNDTTSDDDTTVDIGL